MNLQHKAKVTNGIRPERVSRHLFLEESGAVQHAVLRSQQGGIHAVH